MPASRFDTDIIVIGAGTAGLNAFDEIVRMGRTVLLVDQGPLGTMCARVGCMPSKAVLHAAQRASVVRELVGRKAVDEALRQRLWREALAFRDRMADGAARSAKKRAGKRLVVGPARFVDANTVEVEGRAIRARAFIVAVGSAPVVPESFATLGDRVLTTDSLFSLDVLPARIGIVGAGAIGLEMGLALARLGVAVTLADEARAVAGIVDPAVARQAAKRLGEELPLWLGRKVTASRYGRGVRMTSGSRHVDVDRLLVAVGRKPVLDDLDLAAAGVALDDEGGVDVDRAVLRCGDTTVLVAGDAHDDVPLLHEASDDGTICARQAVALLDRKPLRRYERRARLSIVFSDPDVAAIGTPFDELDRGTFVTGAAEGSDNGRSILLDAEAGLLRLYAAKRDGRLLGATVFAKGGEHLAHLLAWAVQRGETVESLLQLPYYHPTVEELVGSALRDAAKKLGDVDANGLVVESGTRRRKGR